MIISSMLAAKAVSIDWRGWRNIPVETARAETPFLWGRSKN